MMKPIYNRRGWPLAYCCECGRLQYVEPHGTTWDCRACGRWTEHHSVPAKYTDEWRLTYHGPARVTVVEPPEGDDSDKRGGQ